jgi:hypothetical protein
LDLRQYWLDDSVDGYTRNMLVLLKLSQSHSARYSAQLMSNRLIDYFRHITLNTDIITAIAERDHEEAEAAFEQAFPYGWLDPKGQFIPCTVAMHEANVYSLTGFRTCDAACAAGWVKFTTGLPYGDKDQILFESGSDTASLTPAQATWLRNWLVSISEPGERTPHF